MTQTRRSSLIFAASAVVTCVFFINFCALVFQCGCHSLWNGADATCNVHRHGVRHCPWCAQNPAWAFLSMIGAQAAVSYGRRAWSWPVRLALAIAAFPAAGIVAAGIYGWYSGYWR